MKSNSKPTGHIALHTVMNKPTVPIVWRRGRNIISLLERCCANKLADDSLFAAYMTEPEQLCQVKSVILLQFARTSKKLLQLPVTSVMCIIWNETDIA